VVYSITFAVSLTVSEIGLQAVNFVKTTFLLAQVTRLVFDLEFEGHAVGILRRNLAPEN